MNDKTQKCIFHFIPQNQKPQLNNNVNSIKSTFSHTFPSVTSNNFSNRKNPKHLPLFQVDKKIEKYTKKLENLYCEQSIFFKEKCKKK